MVSESPRLSECFCIFNIDLNFINMKNNSIKANSNYHSLLLK